MISTPYETRTAAEEAAKEYAQENNITKFILTLDPKAGTFHFTDQDQAPTKTIAFKKLRLIKGKWRDRTANFI
jgi:hypothetical protein